MRMQPWSSVTFRDVKKSIILRRGIANFQAKDLGDWTHTLCQRVPNSCTRLGYVAGPYPTPYSCAAEHDKLILCASGIGITPALGVLTKNFARRANLVSCSHETKTLNMLRCKSTDYWYSHAVVSFANFCNLDQIWVCRDRTLIRFVCENGQLVDKRK